MDPKIPAPPITYFFSYVLLLLAFHKCNIIILYLCLSIKFCLSNSLQTDTNSFLTPVFPATLLAISISNLSTSAIGSHDKMMVGTEGVRPFPVYRFFYSQISFDMCFHFQLLLAFGLVSLSSLFLLNAFVECIISA